MKKYIKVINKVGSSCTYKEQTYRVEEEGLCQWQRQGTVLRLVTIFSWDQVDLRSIKA